MRVVVCYTDPGGIRYVKFDKDIVVIEAEKIVSDEVKLQKVLKVQRERDPSVMGIVISENVQIKLHNSMKFSGIIWSTRAKLSGKFDFI